MTSMTWWQTLLVGVVPVTITALALLAQQHLNARSARALHRLQTRASRREEMLTAHRQALSKLSAIYNALHAEGAFLERPGKDIDAETLRREAEGAQQVVAEVALLCGKESHRAANAFHLALLELRLALLRYESEPTAFWEAGSKCNDARNQYLMAAKKELETD